MLLQNPEEGHSGLLILRSGAVLFFDSVKSLRSDLACTAAARPLGRHSRPHGRPAPGLFLPAPAFLFLAPSFPSSPPLRGSFSPALTPSWQWVLRSPGSLASSLACLYVTAFAQGFMPPTGRKPRTFTSIQEAQLQTPRASSSSSTWARHCFLSLPSSVHRNTAAA